MKNIKEDNRCPGKERTMKNLREDNKCPRKERDGEPFCQYCVSQRLCQFYEECIRSLRDGAIVE